MSQQANVFVIPGQGGHYFHMGEWFFQRELVFKKEVVRLNNYILKQYDVNVLSCLYDADHSPADWFSNILYSHPAIFILQYALAKLLIAKGNVPDCIIGISLGELIGLSLLGHLDEYECLDIIMHQAGLLQEIPKSCMLIWVKSKVNLELLKEKGFFIAGKLSPDHYIIACTNEQFVNEVPILRAAGETFEKLMVDYGFHSPLVSIPGCKLPCASLSKGLQNTYEDYYSALSQDYLADNHLWRVFEGVFDLPLTLSKVISNYKHVRFCDVSFTDSLRGLLAHNKVEAIEVESYGSKLKLSGPY